MLVADSVAFTVAFGTAAPDGSVTVPLMAPRKVWLFAVTTTTRVRSNTDRHRFIYRFPLARSNSYQWPPRSRPLPPTKKKIRPAHRRSSRQIEVLKLTKGTPQSQYGTCWEHPNAALAGVSMQMIE